MKYKKVEVIGGLKVTKHKEGARFGEVLTDESGNTKVFLTAEDADKAIEADKKPKKGKETKKSTK